MIIVSSFIQYFALDLGVAVAGRKDYFDAHSHYDFSDYGELV